MNTIYDPDIEQHIHIEEPLRTANIIIIQIKTDADWTINRVNSKGKKKITRIK